MKDPYDTIGVPKDASQNEIKDVFRKKAKKAHPDLGGSDAKCMALTLAYAIIGNPDKRAHYDLTGEEKKATNDNACAVELLVGLFKGLLGDVINGQPFNVIEEMRTRLEGTNDMSADRARNGKAQLRNLKRLEKKLKHKSDKTPDFLSPVYLTMYRELETQIEEAEEEVRIGKIALERLKEYGFDFEQQDPGYGVNDLRRVQETISDAGIDLGWGRER